MTNDSHGPLHYRGQRWMAKDAGLIWQHSRIPPEYREQLIALVQPFTDLGGSIFARTSAERKIEELERELAWKIREIEEELAKIKPVHRRSRSSKSEESIRELMSQMSKVRENLTSRISHAQDKLRDLDQQVDLRKRELDDYIREQEKQQGRLLRVPKNARTTGPREPESERKRPGDPAAALKFAPPAEIGDYAHRKRLVPVA